MRALSITGAAGFSLLLAACAQPNGEGAPAWLVRHQRSAQSESAPPPESPAPTAEAPSAAPPLAAAPAPVEKPAPKRPAPAIPGGGAAFRISDLPAEWDGEETAGGLWVALPYLPSYRRVLIQDPKTGRAVVAKLYWRDPLPGADEAVLSSAAAEALGLKPGRTTIEAAIVDE